jgi:ABC-2 type transport system permease protein
MVFGRGDSKAVNRPDSVWWNAKARKMTNRRQYGYLLQNMVSRDLKIRYKRSFLGYAWTMLNPLMHTVVFTIVFSTIFRFEMKDYVVYFLSAYLIWSFFAQTTLGAALCILQNAELLKKVYVPKKVFVFSTVISGLVHLAFAFLPLAGLMCFTVRDFPPISSLLFVPIALLYAVVFTSGVSFILAAMGTFFHDVIEVYRVILMPWMYLTPIIYPMNIVPEKFAPLIQLNPMFHIIQCFGTPIYGGRPPDPAHVVYGGLAALAVLIVGYTLFSRLEKSFVYYL